jgi:hypothetical protein
MSKNKKENFQFRRSKKFYDDFMHSPNILLYMECNGGQHWKRILSDCHLVTILISDGRCFYVVFYSVRPFVCFHFTESYWATESYSVTQPVPSNYWTREIYPLANWIKFQTSHHIPLISILIVSSHLCLGLLPCVVQTLTILFCLI